MKKNIAISLEELLYYLMLSVLLFTKGIGLEEGSWLFRGCLMLGISFYCVKLAVGKYSFSQLIVMTVLVIWGISTFLITGTLGMFIYMLMITGMKNIPLKRVFKVGTWVWGGSFFLTTTLAIFFDRTGVRLVHEKLGMGPLIRESLGYTHPNVLHVTYIVLMLFVLYLCRERGKKIFTIIALLLIGDMYVFLYSVSYTGLLISFVALGIYFYFTYRKEIGSVEKLLIQLILPICLLMSIILPPLLSNEGIVYKMLNVAMNNRIWAIQTFFDMYPLTLFGMSSEGIKYSLDNSYVYALMSYGVSFLVIMPFVYFSMIRFFLKKDYRMELMVICTLLIGGLSEPYLFNTSIKNISVFLIGYFLFQQIRGEEKVTLGLIKNKVVEFNLEPKCNFKVLWQNVNKRQIVTAFLLIGVVSWFVVSMRYDGIDEVYADEKYCDCEGETVSLPKEIDDNKILYIGDISPNINYYYFNSENSKLIQIMNYRKKLSICLYVAGLGSIIAAGVSRIKRKVGE